MKNLVFLSIKKLLNKNLQFFTNTTYSIEISKNVHYTYAFFGFLAQIFFEA